MSYTKEINRKNPTCFLFVIDQSGSMDETMSGGSIKSEFVADVLNRTIAETIVRCTKADGVRDYFEIGVIGYGGDDVGSAFGGGLSGRTLLPISEIESNPLRIEEREHDVDTGDDVLDRQVVKFPVWIDPQHDGGTPMCTAMGIIAETVAEWCDAHPNSYPPTVVHVTDGQSTDGSPEEIARRSRAFRPTTAKSSCSTCTSTRKWGTRSCSRRPRTNCPTITPACCTACRARFPLI